MGSCFSKKTTTSSPNALPDPPDQINIHNTQAAEKKAEEEILKKEILIVKPRKSHDRDCRSEEEKARVDQTVTASCASDVPSEAADLGSSSATSTNNEMNLGLLPNGGVVVRTSSCTKEEVDAILIQCGRLSRSASAGRAAVSGSGGSCGRKYSGSKRSYDFDHETSSCDKDKKKGDGIEDNDFDDNVGGGGDEERIHRRHRHRQRQSRPSSSPARRRTPSRERDLHHQQRSGSRERRSSSGGSGGGGGGRRVSRSPGRRFESPMSNASGSNNCGNNSSNNKPGKMVSVPATISSLAMDKSNNGGGAEAPSASANKRIMAKRNAGDSAMGCRSAASPRSRSPARANVRAANENQQQPLSLSRSNSRKADQSPYRRNPLGEIDQNCIGFEGPQKPSVENVKNSRTGSGKVTVDSKNGTLNCRAKEQQHQTEEGLQQPTNCNVAVTVVVPSGGESLKPPQALTRSRSSRLSRDLEINPDTLLNPSPPSSYTALLLEDIQNFHHKPAPAISLPPCVTKACSILEAVADLNSNTGIRSPTTTAEQLNRGLETKKDPFVESEVLVSNDLMEPSFHRYVTLRRGTVGVGDDDDMEEQESSGSNSFVGGSGAHQNWVSSSCSGEPNSADSTGRWTTSRSNGKEDEVSPLGFQRHDADRECPRRLGEKNHQQNGIGRGRVGSSRGLLHSMPTTATLAAAAST